MAGLSGEDGGAVVHVHAAGEPGLAPKVGKKVGIREFNLVFLMSNIVKL